MSAARAIEIERKFLVRSDAWRPGARGTRYRQGYLCCSARATVRVRLGPTDAWLTIKRRLDTQSAAEFEYPLPISEAQELLETACQGHLVEKTRYRVTYDRHVWEIDEFQAANEGLVLAEVELSSLDTSPGFPDWIGIEVTGQKRYTNAYLSRHPFGEWADRPKLGGPH